MACSCLQIASLKIWRIVKIIVGICAIICAGIMFSPLVCNYSIAQYIVTGVLALAAIGILVDALGWEQVLIKFKEQISRLSTQVDRLEAVEKEMKHVVDNLQEENRQYEIQNNKYADQIKQQSDLLVEQKQQNKLFADENTRLKIIEKNYRSMLDELTATGSDIKNTSEIIADSAAKIETNTNALETITNEMIVDKFDEIDSNDDGLITKQELIDFAKRRRAIMRMNREKLNK